MPDDAELCCAAGVCCNQQKRRVALANILTEKVGHAGPFTAVEIADAVHDLFDIVPKSLGLGVFLHKFADMAREHPYE